MPNNFVYFSVLTNFISRNCFGVYERGLTENIPIHDKKLLSDFYLDTLIKLITTCDTKTDDNVITFLKKSVDTLFYRASDYKFIDRVDHFIFWVTFL